MHLLQMLQEKERRLSKYLERFHQEAEALERQAAALAQQVTLCTRVRDQCNGLIDAIVMFDAFDPPGPIEMEDNQR